VIDSTIPDDSSGKFHRVHSPSLEEHIISLISSSIILKDQL
jgi:hypothetical protein